MSNVHLKDVLNTLDHVSEIKSQTASNKYGEWLELYDGREVYIDTNDVNLVRYVAESKALLTDLCAFLQEGGTINLEEAAGKGLEWESASYGAGYDAGYEDGHCDALHIPNR